MRVNREPPTEAPGTKKKKPRGGVRTQRALKGEATREDRDEERQEHRPAHTSFIYVIFSVVSAPDVLDVKLLVREQQTWSCFIHFRKVYTR